MGDPALSKGSTRPMTEVSPQIIRRCQEGDIRAAEAIYRAYADRVFRLSLRLMGSHADAEDATQEVFMRAHKGARFEAIGSGSI